MSTTFYGVLGVGPDADDEAIRSAYRERVKDHHPDVSTAPDAADRFKRLTTAKEALLDGAERARYDRLGHVDYVRQHGDDSLWSMGERDGDTDGSDDRSGDTDDCDDRSVDPADCDDRAADTDDRDTSRSADTGPSAGPGQTSRRRDGDGSRSGTGSRSVSDARSAGGSSQSSSARATAGSRSTDRSRTGDRSQTASTSTGGGATRRSTAPGGSYARSSFWQATERADASAEPYRSGRLSDRALSVLRALGPWLLIHLLFLSLAVGTGWYVYAVILSEAQRSLPLLLVLVGEIGLAAVLSTLHVLSRVFR